MTRTLFLTLPLLLAALLLPVGAFATEWHVSVTGDDSNDGTADAPFRTLAHATTVAEPGDQIVVEDAVYDDPAWTSLFDGESLDGWHVKATEADRDKTYWHVRDGVIHCDSMGDPDHNYVWLMSDEEYDDFELRLQIRSYADSDGNSGVQVRSRYDDEDEWLNGPQIDIHPPDGFRSGLIYDETRGYQRWIYPSLPNPGITHAQGPSVWEWHWDGWNDVYIRCEGTRIFTMVNGYVIADYDGAGLLDDETHQQFNVGMRGHIALQLHIGCELLMDFRDIYVRPL